MLGAVITFAATRGSSDEVAATAESETSVPTGPSTVDSDIETESDAEIGSDTTISGPLGAEALAHSVVQIQLLLDGAPVCTGSGTIVDVEGTVVTNFHVVEQSPICPHDQIGIAIAQSSDMTPVLTYAADLLAFDSDLDLAVIRIARLLNGSTVTEQFTPVEVGDSDAVELGDELRVIGYPGIGGETVTFTTGSVSGFAQTPEGGQRSWLKTDATITGGNSGGLAADAAGRFVGIPSRVGTGNGQIVDCRVIADSNGDGQLNGNDSCVPIGGFINGIRPVALAIPLIEAARTAAPIDQGPPERQTPMSMDVPQTSNPVWTSEVNENGRATDELVAAEAGLPQLCLTWDFESVPIGSVSDAVWFIDGELIESASVFGSVNETGTVGSYFACINQTGGLFGGTYEFAWLIDDEFVFSEGIIVDRGLVAIVEVQNNTAIPLCVVQFNPGNTDSYGLNELTEPLAPGDSIVVEVGLGLLDARVIDCDGDIRIEDSSGFEITNDISVSVD